MLDIRNKVKHKRALVDNGVRHSQLGNGKYRRKIDVNLIIHAELVMSNPYSILKCILTLSISLGFL